MANAEGPGRDDDPQGAPAPGDLATEIDSGSALGGALAGVGGHERVYLVCRHGGEFRVLDLAPGQELVVGRAAGCDLVVDNTRVSRRHTRFVRGEAGLSVEDLGSRNGTLVGGVRLSGASRPIGGGDVVQIGPAEVVVAVTATAGAAAAVPEAEAAAGAGAAAAAAEDADDDMPPGVVVADAAMRKIFQMARRLAGTSTTVLVMGETGVGKEVVAEQIHRWSQRAERPFVRLNCASVPEPLLESEFFGHEKGAFTGADRRKVGYFQAAHGGTLMLDEIGELPLAIQAKLLRVLETRRVVLLGGTQEVSADVRLICATHRDLREDVEAGRFRKDLFYRISTFTLDVPPLRTRPTEVIMLARLFARQFAQNMSAPEPTLDPATVAALARHSWPGNVRELRNAMEHAVILANGAALRPEHLPTSVVEDGPAGPRPGRAGDVDVRDQIAAIERKAVEDALAAEGGNQTRAAQRLGLTRRALIYRLEKYKIRR